ncbi:hypothetical protein TSUD_266230 [Trifolium subterraneum]|uniref:MSP domain-containing protein n=1 Tax=Trifolium subterraneum TaxID=3900 RepID=A0A2Z6M1M8_TRISU|nr:hypothetical protein TSUD_266230 [Trifolium subterraneum]
MLLLLNQHPQFEKDLIKIQKLQMNRLNNGILHFSFYIQIHPQELQFPFELKKQVPCSLQLSNNSDNVVAFKVKTTNAKNYYVRPNIGLVFPRSTCDIIVTMQAQTEAPPDMQCKDKFLIRGIVLSKNGEMVMTKDITSKMVMTINNKMFLDRD